MNQHGKVIIMTTYRGTAQNEKRAIRARTELRFRLAQARAIARAEAEAAESFAATFEQGLEVFAPREREETPESWADLY
jgi:hypothetical protein